MVLHKYKVMNLGLSFLNFHGEVLFLNAENVSQVGTANMDSG